MCAGLSWIGWTLSRHDSELPCARPWAWRRRRSIETDRLVLGAATLGLFEAATEAEPLLLVVDDAHWLDGESAAVLLFAARRLEAEPVAVLFAGREGLADHGLEELEVRGLEESDARALLGHVAKTELRARTRRGEVDRLHARIVAFATRTRPAARRRRGRRAVRGARKQR